MQAGRVSEENETWDLFDLDISYAVWVLLEATGWKHLPDDGNLLGQDEALMRDISTITWISSVIEQMLKQSEDAA